MQAGIAAITRLRRSSGVIARTACSLLAIAAFSTPADGQDALSELPGKESMVGLSVLVGEWSMNGVTAIGQEGVPGGRFFTARQQVEWIEPGSALGVEWSVRLDDGTGIASGRGRIAWDDIAGAIVNTYRGEEAGRRFSGNATLIATGSDETFFDWRGHETGGTSDSVNFEVTYIFPDQDSCFVDFIPTCLDGDAGPEPARFSWKRVNPFDAAIPFASELVGEWVLRSGGSESSPDGSRMVIRPGRGGLSLSMTGLEAGESGGFIFSDLLWLDPSTAKLQSRWLGADGDAMRGSPSLSTRDGRPALRVVWEVEGTDDPSAEADRVRMVSSLTVDGDRLDLSYTSIDEDGAEVEGPVLPSPKIWERLSP